MKQWISLRSYELRLWSTSEQSASSWLSLPAISASGHATAAPTSAAPGLCSTPINERIADIDPSHRQRSPLHRNISVFSWPENCPSVIDVVLISVPD